ncbi:HAD hydrolase-like protein [Candidatus Woesearchaeota archaeon]|nr:HAD hydrolase-like protein [Candidatus Woesearchaeota archaeon]
MRKLALFDIDWTLLEPSKAHALAFKEGFRQVYHVDATHENLKPEGWNDQRIIIESLKQKGLSEQSIESKLGAAMKFMSDYFIKIIDKYPVVTLDGAKQLLEELYKKKVLIGVVTGNLEPIAREKLKRVGFEKYIKVGGYGSDNIDRTELVRIAIKQAENNYGFKTNHNVFLFGDTPHDIKAGKEAGVITIGVATGTYSKEKLKLAKADYVINSLSKINEIKRIILL